MARPPAAFIPPDTIRAWFADAMSAMYAREVPLYATLVEIVARTNAGIVASGAVPASDIARLGAERHGAIRVGHAPELAGLARVFGVMGMAPVGYYDLAPAGIPVHSTAFRPTTAAALAASPFRIFTSLLRLDLIEDEGLRATAADILSRRRILSDRALALTAQAEQDGGLGEADARAFVDEVLATFRWHNRATVDRATYRRLVEAHRLVADIVAFPGPHINHLTPRTLDIDRAHAEMGDRGLRTKAAIEGPPTRAVPILLRQTSFHALEEPVRFTDEVEATGGHTARFGEIEQRGAALTPAGRALYDRLLADAQADAAGAEIAAARLGDIFRAFPDAPEALRRERLAFFLYAATDAGKAVPRDTADPDALVDAGWATATPIVYEDFLPVSAAGIFRSNLGAEPRGHGASASSQAAFEAALGRAVIDPFALYAAEEAASIERLRFDLRSAPQPNV